MNHSLPTRLAGWALLLTLSACGSPALTTRAAEAPPQSAPGAPVAAAPASSPAAGSEARVAAAPPAAGARRALRVCEDPNNLPFSSASHDGIENKLAEVFAKALGLPLAYYDYPARMNFVRNTLRYKLPGEDYRCDLMMGVPIGFDQVSVTKPVYRSTYALVFRAGEGLDGVRSASDFLALPQALRDKLRIGIVDRSPASIWLAKHGMVDQGVPYPMLSADPGANPGHIVEDELAKGKIDVAVLWGPIGGFFAQRVKSPALKVVPLQSEPGVKFDFEMALGVRYGEPQWKQQIEAVIDSHRSEIETVLKSFGVPLVAEGGAPL